MGQPRMIRALVVLVATLSGCRCVDSLTGGTGQLRVAPESLDLGSVYVGSSASRQLELQNDGRAPIEVAVVVEGPFVASLTMLVLAGGSTELVSVSFSPSVPGAARGVVRLGDVEVALSGEGLEVPACAASPVCRVVHFDLSAARCVETNAADGLACETRCLTGGCQAGECRGALKGCDDADACTTDACDEVAGCSHQPRTCPAPANPCLLARCDSASGCGTEPAPDGTLCGPDDCTAREVDVCVNAVCSRRARPDSARCANRWVPSTLPTRDLHAQAWDPSRQQVLFFGGSTAGLSFDGVQLRGEPSADTWAWNGTAWTELIPPASPPPRFGHVMAVERAHGRLMLFGGKDATGLLDDTWEWTGVTWVLRPTAGPSPSPRYGHAACEAPGGRVVLFGGFVGPNRDDLSDETWEWNGRSWRHLAVVHSPPPRMQHAMAWDPARRRVVLVGGLGRSELLNDVWEFDGVDWVRTPGLLTGRSGHSMAYDAATHAVAVFGGLSVASTSAELALWNGERWLPTVPAGPSERIHAALATDERTNQLVLFGGNVLLGDAATWLWSGTAWRRGGAELPTGHQLSTVAIFDRVRQRLVMSTGLGADAVTWEWDGAAWRVAGQGLPSLGVMTRSATGRALNVWTHAVEWNGSSWQQVGAFDAGPSTRDLAWASTPQGLLAVERSGTAWEWTPAVAWRTTHAALPSFGQAAMAFDPSRSQALLVGMTNQAPLWQWSSGSTPWQRLPVVGGPAMRDAHVMAYDTDRRVIVLFGGRRGTPVNDTWEWDGAAWTERLPVRVPTKRFPVFLVYDEAAHRMLLFDGAVTWQLVL